MRLHEFFLRNPAFMAVLLLLLVALGYNAWRQIPRAEDPAFESTTFSVIALYPGADALDVERRVAKPIEDALNGLDDVHELRSTSSDGLMRLTIEFDDGVDTDRKHDEVVREIDALRSRLPSGLQRVDVEQVDPSGVNIVQLALVAKAGPDPASWGRLADLAEDLRDRLDTLPGVREADTWAYPRRELRVALDLDRLARAGLSADAVFDAVDAENRELPAGAVESGDRRFNLKTSGAYGSVEELADTVVSAGDGRVLRLRDVADVGWRYQPEDHLARYDGQRAVWITARQQPEHNIFDVQAAIETEVEAFRGQLPPGIELDLAFRQSDNVAKRLSHLGLDFAIAAALVSITLLPLGLRAAGIVMISIPLSLAMGLAALHALGFSLNQLSIAGFVIALGLLVDDAIVVVENIARYLREGHGRMQASILATRQIALAVLGCTAVLLLAFAPLAALPDNAGRFIRSLPMAVMLTVLASLFVALLVVPFIASRVLELEADPQGNRLLQAVMRFIHHIYAPLLSRALARPRATLAISCALVLASLALIPAIGLTVFPKADSAQFLVRIELPEGSSLARTEAVMNEIEADLSSRPEVLHVMSNVGRGNPRIYYNLMQRETSARYAELFVQLKAFDPVATPDFYRRLRERYDPIPGADIVVKEFENGPGIEAPVELRIVGADLRKLGELAARVEALMRNTPGLRDVDNPMRRNRMDLQLKVDAQRAALLGVSPAALDRVARIAVGGLVAGDYRRADGESYPVVLRAPMEHRTGLDALDGLHVMSRSGGQVPLPQLAEPVLVSSVASIDRYRRERSVTVSAQVDDGYNVQELTRALVGEIERSDWMPDGYRLHVGGEVESSQNSFAGFDTALLAAAFGILAVLVLEFGSLRSTLIVAAVVPLGAMGGLVALFASGYSLSFTAMIGFIALIGIEIKNSILLVDFTDQLRRQGLAVREAVTRAGELRFLPILLTSATAVGGLLPLATQGSGLYSPLAWVIIGGLVSSTLVGRLVTPVMYLLLPPRLNRPGTADSPGSPDRAGNVSDGAMTRP
ncbi:efflux RND transporter permease subunit [Hydrocarboniphaga effusa]|uniref:efflux RND transporter permease subunit n=1 Tax=Hydrocarboniphaga effusa TaxID=243629 RepID=UPI0035B4D41A